MSGRLRSLALCATRPEIRHGVAGWRKTRLRRTRWMTPPGNLLLRLLGAGCVVCAREWARHETTTFSLVHPDQPKPRVLSETEIWLPHLPGIPVSDLAAGEQSNARAAAFRELGRLHRLGLGHGDPHRGNFLHEPATGRCRIMDFETRFDVFDQRARALDAAILALDFARTETPPNAEPPRPPSLDGLDDAVTESLTQKLLRAPGWRLRWYWRLLGYRSVNGSRAS